ncbi:protein adenylyltransferase SelO [Candidatus Atelocyanobacterium thalassae]|uniref:Protein nucleotidyltransferase YdiU n=1 Tax=cyanobacterium endosymbiont of Braarudosphaera bigelowii TaxID=1285375 RepID=A0ABM7U3S2_9CHRO|nr:YdiU family protein [Candidatus Atelocyanobacterium thalassa]BDA39354.1 hypothetical protein CPARK_000019300 [cyanobacterium endosymbiont of Braarudosphaera bigelowii]
MTSKRDNPFFSLEYQTTLEDLGSEYYDEVDAAKFPQHILKFRNNDLLKHLGLASQDVDDIHFIEAFGKFKKIRPFLALSYHGYQFGEYNPFLGDGRGFLYGQVKGINGQVYDFGTKGSGKTPYSRGGDGKLTLKGGIREVLAAEILHRIGVKTSRCLSLIETGEKLWRGDEPSPTRSSVMVRMSRSHIRFGTFERLYHLKRPDLIKKLLDVVINVYYPEIALDSDRYGLFYEELVKRSAQLVAHWMAAGFCHGVLNTDNMSIIGESFDYGPYAFINTYDPCFTSAYFDHGRRYSYGNQPLMIRTNLEMLQLPLMSVISPKVLETGISQFSYHYENAYRKAIFSKLGLTKNVHQESGLLEATIDVLRTSQINYHQFFIYLIDNINKSWWKEPSNILEKIKLPAANWVNWKRIYNKSLNEYSSDQVNNIINNLNQFNIKTPLLKSKMESLWDSIASHDDWEPFYQLIKDTK